MNNTVLIVDDVELSREVIKNAVSLSNKKHPYSLQKMRSMQ